MLNLFFGTTLILAVRYEIRFNGYVLVAVAFFYRIMLIISKKSINQRTHAQFPHNKKANDMQ